MTYKEMLRTAMEQSTEDIGCHTEDFLSDSNVICPFRLGINARKYLTAPISCSLVSYGNNLVAAAADEIRDDVQKYIDKFEYYHCFETPSVHWLNERISMKGHKVCFMAEFYLLDENRRGVPSCDYETRLLFREDFKGFYLPEWSNALCNSRKHLDVLGVGAYDNGVLIGLAGCSADCDSMWQIGVDVLKGYRRKGIASAITSRLANEIIERGKVPFYCSAWSNIPSVRNVVKSGFLPAWAELSCKPSKTVEAMNA